MLARGQVRCSGHPSAPRRGTPWAVAAIALVGGAVILGAGASAQGPAARTLKLKDLDKGSTFTHIRNTKTKSQRSNSAGDLIVTTFRVADAIGKVVGKSSLDCTTTTGARYFKKSTITCAAVLALRDGTLTLQGNLTPVQLTTVAAVTGGTGAYANARGVLVSKPVKSGQELTITFTTD